MSEAKVTGRKVNKPGCATVRNQATALFSLPMRLGQHVALRRNKRATQIFSEWMITLPIFRIDHVAACHMINFITW